jgi:hypothetical protein
MTMRLNPVLVRCAKGNSMGALKTFAKRRMTRRESFISPLVTIRGEHDAQDVVSERGRWPRRRNEAGGGSEEP